MKTRILHYLDVFAKGEPSDLADELKSELGMDDLTFQQNSQSVQSVILHQYSQFSISTIDAFFQRVIRSFTRESGLIGDYRLEVDHDAIVDEVIDSLIDELGHNKELTSWVVEFAKENLENERAWDVRVNLKQFAKEIFREEFKAIEESVHQTTKDPAFFRNLRDELWKIKSSFIGEVSVPAQEVLSIIRSEGWAAEDFAYGRNSGLGTFFQTFATAKNLSEMVKGPSDRLRNYFSIAANWPSKKSARRNDIFKAAEADLIPRLNKIIQHYDNQFVAAHSAEVTLRNLYVFGLIADIARKLKEYKDENNVMLLADAPKFLNGIIQDSDTPFIYEKVGSFYRNYLIDEFQDTSGMQWKNFQPLIMNGLDQGYPALVVGDVKQAIYRWRGGDLNLLQREVFNAIGPGRVSVQELDRNFRSSSEVVNFNNSVFESAAAIVAAQTGVSLATEAYSDGSQKVARKENGFVHITFIEDQQSGDADLFSTEAGDQDVPARWSQVALETIPDTLEKLQSLGAELKDIAILVRKNDEGQRIAAHLLNYKSSPDAKVGFRYDVVSNESLRIDGASIVNLLVSAMKYLLNSDDAIARAQLAFENARQQRPRHVLSDVFLVTNQTIFESQLPPAFTHQKSSLKKLPLIELTETLIGIFELGKIQGELVHLQAFQDLVLEFSSRERNDLGSFLEWWEDIRLKKSVQISGDVNAAQILTIHKSKGLQFKYVIVPFCSWGLDHESWQAPNLWVSGEVMPFANAGYLPVKYSSALKETFFRSYYEEERTKTYLDNLNLLYVAFTRAERGLVISAPAPKTRQHRNSVASLLYESLQSSDSLKISWREGGLSWSTSDVWPIHAEGSGQEEDVISLEHYRADPWRSKLVIRQTGGSWFDGSASERKNSIDRGIQIHQMLSLMKTKDDIEGALRLMVDKGMLVASDITTLKEELDHVLSLPEVAPWFDPLWQVQTEVPILLPDGSSIRLDRLLTKDKQAVIIDFKTGSEQRADTKQVWEYMQVLHQMNFIDVKGYLLYVKTRTVIEVTNPTAPKVSAKTKNKDQLSLGL